MQSIRLAIALFAVVCLAGCTGEYSPTAGENVVDSSRSSSTSTAGSRSPSRSPAFSEKPGFSNGSDTTSTGDRAASTESRGDRSAAAAKGEAAEADALAVFNKRILPIMQSKKPSSCTECHLAGVELQNYILPDPRQTFAALRRQGLVDVDDPDNSKILTFIARKPEKSSPISEKVRAQELAAFRAWIRAAVWDPEFLKATAAGEVNATKVPLEVIRHARRDRVLASFIDNIWSQMGRCIGCHSPDRNQRLVKKHGEQVSWIVPNDPQATLAALVDGGNIDLDEPERSPVLLKPAGQMEHGGGPKFLVGGPAYRGFVSFLKDYAATANGGYSKPADLPAPPSEVVYLTRQHLRIVDLPERFDKLPLKVDLYRWDDERKSWSPERWGTAFGRVNGKRRLWQSMIAVTAPSGSKRADEIRERYRRLMSAAAKGGLKGGVETAREPRLPPGTYLAKLYVDTQRMTEQDPNYELGEDEYIGQVEIAGPWKIGYQPPKIVHAPALTD